VDGGEYLLPSDSTNRTDMQYMKLKDWEKAEHDKLQMEELQRHDKKLRTLAANKNNKK